MQEEDEAVGGATPLPSVPMGGADSSATRPCAQVLSCQLAHFAVSTVQQCQHAEVCQLRCLPMRASAFIAGHVTAGGASGADGARRQAHNASQEAPSLTNRGKYRLCRSVTRLLDVYCKLVLHESAWHTRTPGCR